MWSIEGVYFTYLFVEFCYLHRVVRHLPTENWTTSEMTTKQKILKIWHDLTMFLINTAFYGTGDWENFRSLKADFVILKLPCVQIVACHPPLNWRKVKLYLKQEFPFFHPCCFFSQRTGILQLILSILKVTKTGNIDKFIARALIRNYDPLEDVCDEFFLNSIHRKL